jgi:hypothetical protein
MHEARRLHRWSSSRGKNMVSKSHAHNSTARRTLLAACTVAALFASPVGVCATATATASAVIVTPVSVTNTANLSFGSFDPGTTGTVTVDTTGARHASGVTLAGGTPGAAEMTISGQSGLSYSISYAGTSTSLRNGADTLDMVIVSDLGGAATSSGAPVVSGTLGAGPATLRIGGILSVSNPGNQPGAYTGIIAVAVQYQ